MAEILAVKYWHVSMLILAFCLKYVLKHSLICDLHVCVLIKLCFLKS